jgi:hypothetical protein
LNISARGVVAERGAAWLFWALLASFAAIYLAFYPRTYAIFDECCILSLAYSLRHATIFVDHAGPIFGLRIGAHVVSQYSAFHAALLTPALMLNWKLAFALTAGFFVLGAFVLRAMLLRDGLGAGWSALYFLLAGALYYSQTLMAAVPAAVMGLIGVSMLMRPEPRPTAGGVAFGASVLLHLWMAPMAVVFAAIWLCERGWRLFWRDSAAIALGAAPCIVALAAYNYLTVGSPFRDVYVITGQQYNFSGTHFFPFAVFYLGSLALFPLGGWAVLSSRWSRGWALPTTAAAMLALASLYSYRDGLNVGSARVGMLVGLVAGLIPGQRFLLPVSMLACLPAARFLDARLSEAARGWRHLLPWGALAVFTAGFLALSAAHEAYLDAHAEAQRVLARALPADAEIVIGSEMAGDDLVKEFAPIGKIHGRVNFGGLDAPAPGAYVSYLARPGDRPPEQWIAGRRTELIPIRSWAWNRDLWIGEPADAGADAASH